MLKIFLFTISLCTLMAPCMAQKTCTVSGTVRGLNENPKVYIVKRVGEYGADTVARSVMKNGKFTLQLPASLNGLIYTVHFEGSRNNTDFVAEPGDVNIDGDFQNFYFAKVSGTKENDKLYYIRNYNRRINEKRMQLPREQMMAVNRTLQHFTDSIIASDPRSIVSLYYAKTPLMMYKIEKLDSLLAFFKPMKNHPYYREMKERADVIRKISVGVDAPDFEAQTPEGGKIRLSDFRGKYVVLDFWASWCVPCRAETIHTKKLYEAFHDKGLEIFSFSLDSKHDAWTKAIAADGMIWKNGSDLVGGKLSPIAAKYGIDGIPAIWVIDPNGKIIAEGLRGDKLFELCNQIFNK